MHTIWQGLNQANNQRFPLMTRRPIFLHIIFLLPMLLILSAICSLNSFAVYAQSALPDFTSEVDVPHLPICGGEGTPVGEVCCVHGYVYLNGEQLDGAALTITAPNGQQEILATQEDSSDPTEAPYYTQSLLAEPLSIEIGDMVTITASSADGFYTQTHHFRAFAGTHRVDLILPQSTIEATWTHRVLPGRYDHASAYDPISGEVILFGGATLDGTHWRDTWAWDGALWREQTSLPAPSARRGHTMIYHEKRQEILLFGGRDQSGHDLNDLWSWNSQTSRWSQIATAISPSARSGHAMTYDQANDTLVLFGGLNDDNVLNDMWTWDGTTWTEISAQDIAPPARYDHTMAYHSQKQQIIVFGGANAEDYLNDTWIWTADQGWSQPQSAGPSQPAARKGHAMLYDAQKDTVVLSGGLDESGSSLDDFWQWVGDQWQAFAVNGTSPQARAGHTLAYNSQQNKVIFIGGFFTNRLDDILFADTWVLDDTAWEQVANVPPFSRYSSSAMAYEQDDAYIIFGGLIGNAFQGRPQNKTYRWHPVSSTWTEIQPATAPPARYGHQLVGIPRTGEDSSAVQLLLFGGIGAGNTYLNDTWLWDGTDWTELISDQKPLSRAHFGLTYNSDANKWLLFGGQNSADQLLNDLWEFDKDKRKWIERTYSNPPQARRSASFVYDSAQQATWLFGGLGQDRDRDEYFGDLWKLTETKWEKISFESGPSPRAGHGAAYDSHRQTLVMAGGLAEGAQFNETWTWDGMAWQRVIMQPLLSINNLSALDYDPIHKQMAGLGDRLGQKAVGEGMLLYEPVSVTVDAMPIANISYLEPKHATYDVDRIQFIGMGADGDPSNEIVAHRWMYNHEILSTEAEFTLPASRFPIDEQVIITYEVEDNEGNVSAPVTQEIIIEKPSYVYLPHLEK